MRNLNLAIANTCVPVPDIFIWICHAVLCTGLEQPLWINYGSSFRISVTLVYFEFFINRLIFYILCLASGEKTRRWRVANNSWIVIRRIRVIEFAISCLFLKLDSILVTVQIFPNKTATGTDACICVNIKCSIVVNIIINWHVIWDQSPSSIQAVLLCYCMSYRTSLF